MANDQSLAEYYTRPEAPRKDVPLTNPKEDILGWHPFAAGIARSIRAIGHDQSMVYAIRGAWGMGKSTVLNFLEQELQQEAGKPPSQRAHFHEAPIKVVRFSPWWFSNSGEILVQLLEALVRGIVSIEGQEPKIQKVKEAARDFYQHWMTQFVIRAASGAVRAIGGPIVGESVAAAGEAAKEVLHERLKEAKTPHDLKAKVEKAMDEAEFRMVVMIDDLDRLQPQEILQVFQAIKAIADFPGITYVLAYDHDVVAHAIQQAGYDNAEAYLSKIVQVPMDLPPVRSTRLQNLLEMQVLNPLRRAVEWQEWRWYEYGKPLFEATVLTPRDVIRLYNAVLPRFYGVRDSVDPFEYLILRWVLCKYPTLTNWIAHYGPSTALDPDLSREVIVEALAKCLQLPHDQSQFQVVRKALGQVFERVRLNDEIGSNEPISSFSALTEDIYLYSCEPCDGLALSRALEIMESESLEREVQALTPQRRSRFWDYVRIVSIHRLLPDAQRRLARFVAFDVERCPADGKPDKRAAVDLVVKWLHGRVDPIPWLASLLQDQELEPCAIQGARILARLTLLGPEKRDFSKLVCSYINRIPDATLITCDLDDISVVERALSSEGDSRFELREAISDERFVLAVLAICNGWEPKAEPPERLSNYGLPKVADRLGRILDEFPVWLARTGHQSLLERWRGSIQELLAPSPPPPYSNSSPED